MRPAGATVRALPLTPRATWQRLQEDVLRKRLYEALLQLSQRVESLAAHRWKLAEPMIARARKSIYWVFTHPFCGWWSSI